jgi:hypothetical protein
MAAGRRGLSLPDRDAVHDHAVAAAPRQLAVRTRALGQEARVRGAVILALQSADGGYRIVFTA